MVVNRKTIPTLIEKREEFSNTSGTLRGIKSPYPGDIRAILLDADSQLNSVEASRLRIDSETAGISYIIMSYETPIAWENGKGEVYKVSQTLTQTSEQHKGLLYLFHKSES